jgi:hypothetical protein
MGFHGTIILLLGCFYMWLCAEKKIKFFSRRLDIYFSLIFAQQKPITIKILIRCQSYADQHKALH